MLVIVTIIVFKAYNGGGYGFVNTDDHMTVTRIANEVWLLTI